MTLAKDLIERVRQEQIRLMDIAEHLEGYRTICDIDQPETARSEREEERLLEWIAKVRAIYSDEDLIAWEQESGSLFESIGMLGDVLDLLETGA